MADFPVVNFAPFQWSVNDQDYLTKWNNFQTAITAMQNSINTFGSESTAELEAYLQQIEAIRDNDVIPAKNTAVDAAAKSQEWAESDTEVEPGKDSAKTWALRAEQTVTGDTVITALKPGTGTQGQIVTPNGAGGLAYDDITIAYVQGLQSALDEKRALTNTSFPRYDLASLSQTGTGTITLDLAQAQSFRHAVTGTTTFEFSNAQGVDKSQPVALYLYDASLGTRVINYPAGVVFGDQAPDFTDKTWALVLFFWSGNEWVGSVGAQG